MGKKKALKEAAAEERETPGNIGDFLDENSLAHRLLKKIDKAKDRAFFLSKFCFCASYASVQFDECELDEMETLLDEIGDELFVAHEMICSSWNYQKETPGPAEIKEQAA